MYLRSKDYLPYIQDGNLQQVISSDDSIRLLVESMAQEEAISYLSTKYNTDQEFTDTNVFSVSQKYFAGSRVELSGFAAYNPASTYLATSNIIVINNNLAYLIKNNSAVPAGIFVPADWYLLGNVGQIFYVALPYPEFNLNSLYKIGDRVFWRDKIYEAKLASVPISHFTRLQAGDISNVPQINIFPDDPLNGLKYWGAGTDYSFTGLSPTATATAWTAGSYSQGNRVTYQNKIWESLINANTTTPGDDITSWQSEVWVIGDNRSQQLVKIMIDLVLYAVHSRIAPRNIPELRVKNYEAAITWLNGCAHGDITPNLPLNQPRSARIIFGGQTKSDFNW